MCKIGYVNLHHGGPVKWKKYFLLLVHNYCTEVIIKLFDENVDRDEIKMIQ